jgi:HSP20 family protein
MIQRYTPMTSRWDPFAEMVQMQKAMNRLFGTPDGAAETFPPVNVYANDEEAVVSAELPGLDPDKLDISVHGDALTLTGAREAEQIGEEASYHRQERFSGRFTRTVALPFNVDSEKVKAQLRNGILTVKLARAEADKPRKIAIENK